MKKSFESKNNAIEWLAEKVGNKRKFEALREQLVNGFNYDGTYFLKLKKLNIEVEIGEDESAYSEAV
jgi:hypothetical protein